MAGLPCLPPFGLKCGIGQFCGSNCGLYAAYKKDDCLQILSDCNKDISRHLQSVKLSGGYQTAHAPAVRSEGELIALRCGIFRFDKETTVCPYHRYSLGIHWKPSKKCTFPSHKAKGGQQPNKTVTEIMSRNIFNKFRCLLPLGSGICSGCNNAYKDLFPSFPKEDECQECFTIEDDNGLGGYHLRERSALQYYDNDSDVTQQSQTLSQISNWSDDIEMTLQQANDALNTVTGGNASPLRAQLRTDISSLKESTVRYYKRKAEESVEAVLNLIAPGQSKELKQLIISEPSKPPTDDELTNTVLKLYEETTDNKLRSQILSVVSKKLTKHEIMQRLPGISKYKVDQARLMAKSTTGLAVEEKVRRPRERMDEEKMQHALNFFFDPSFVQIVSYGTRELEFDTGERVTIPDVVRTACHTQILQMYLAYCKENNFQPLGKSSLFKILKACAASKRTNLHGLDNTAAEGVEAFQSLHELVNNLKKKSVISSEIQNELSTSLTSSRIYMKTDYKLHIQESDMCADHCINWSLSDPNDADFQNPCDHIHSLQCDRCQLLKDIHYKLCSIVDELDNGDEKEEYSKIISDAMTQIFDWKSHMVRSVNQDRFRLDTIEHLGQDQALLVMDWAMKFLPMKYREKQTDWFGQRGRNWHVIVCIYREKDGSVNHRTYTNVFEAVKQDWFCVASVLENVMCTIKDQLPQVKKISLRSDNAGCYHCGYIWLCLPVISKRTGIYIENYCYSEVQAGKSYCDSKIAHMRTKMKTWVASGKNIVTASDMKTALDSGTGVAGCQISECMIDGSKQRLETHKMKGINDFFNVKIQENGIVLRKAYNIGKGQLITNNTLDKMACYKQKDHESGCSIISGFDLPSTVTGKIKTQVSKNCEVENQTSVHAIEEENTFNLESCDIIQEEDSLFYCTVVGCVKKFSTFKGFENHLLLGRHVLKLRKETTYDKIRQQWAKLCNDVVFTSKNKSVQSEGTETEFEVASMGWGLKKGRRISRFSSSVKNFLTAKFEEGNTTGKKCNPSDIAEEMKKIRNSDGTKMFTVSQWLKPSQVTSFFSRLASKGTEKQPVKNEVVDDDDLFAALVAIDEQAIIDAVDGQAIIDNIE